MSYGAKRYERRPRGSNTRRRKRHRSVCRKAQKKLRRREDKRIISEHEP